MRRFLMALVCLLIPIFAWPSSRTGGVDIRIDRDLELTRCDQIAVSFDGVKAAVTEENLPVSSLRSLKLVAGPHGGIRVTGWDGGYEVKACTASALGMAGNVRVRVDGNEVRATGAADDQWVAYYIVRAPRNASLELQAHNGEVSVRDVSGTIAARTENGPLALKNVSGTIDGTTVNGPIAFSGGSGAVRLETTNGPIAVTLTDSDWTGGSVDAHTTNGPVSLRVPASFSAGIVAESQGHGPVSCKGERCPAIRAEIDRGGPTPRKLEIGAGPAVIRVSSVNGPVAVRAE
jgi:DUF4097 and DUF4098 domain-containing protein YvlB